MSANGNLVVIFGAGATRGAFEKKVPPPPLDRDFFDVAGQLTGRGTPRLARRVIHDVYDLYSRVSGVGLEQYFRDIETRAEISVFAKSKNKPKDWARRQKNLEELIRRVLLHTTCNLDKSPARVMPSNLHNDILQHVRSKDTLITFNYDTVIEEAFSKGRNLWSVKDGYGVTTIGSTYEWAKDWLTQRKVDKKTSSRFHLLKLHGSLNWTLYNNSVVRLKPRPYVVRARSGEPVFDKCAIPPPGMAQKN